MFRAEFHSSLDLESAQPVIYLCEILFEINEYLNGLLSETMYGFDEYSNCSIVVCELRFDSDECFKVFLFCEILFWFENWKSCCFIESIGVPPSNNKSWKSHSYKRWGQIIPNYCHSKYGILQYCLLYYQLLLVNKMV